MSFQNRILTLFCTLSVLFSAVPVQGQNFNPTMALASPYSKNDIVKIISKEDSAETNINPIKNSYTVTLNKQGIEIEFNFNMIVNTIWLHNKGSKFSTYKGTMPFGLTWGLNQDSLAKKKYGFIPDSTNMYVMTKFFDRGIATAYFYDNKLSALKLTADDSLLTVNDRENLKYWGLRIYPDGEKIEGDCIAGFGIMMFNGRTSAYEGQWNYGFPNGKGKFTDPEGNTWEGQFLQGFPWGDQVVIAPELFVYEGNILFGKRNGQGKIAYKNGEIYDGEWVNDYMEGKGTYYYNPKFSYRGEFKNGQFNGQGKLETPEGIFEGGFRNGKPHGNGKQMVYRTQATFSGKWIDGKKEGTFQYFDPLSGSKSVFYKNDIEIVKD